MTEVIFALLVCFHSIDTKQDVCRIDERFVGRFQSEKECTQAARRQQVSQTPPMHTTIEVRCVKRTVPVWEPVGE